MTIGSDPDNRLAPFFAALAKAEYIADCALIGLSRRFRRWGEKKAAEVADRHFILPDLNNITAFHMPTIGARKDSDPIKWVQVGHLSYRSPLYDYTRIFAAYDRDSGQWQVTRQKLRMFENEMDAGIGHDTGRLEHFAFANGFDALAAAKKLFDDELYDTEALKRHVRKQVMPDHHPKGSLMHNIVSHLISRPQAGPAMKIA